ncbi:MAG: DUF3261 domain-containing protein [Calothrix sp. SM1_5_4]|nr:DUF3261 domain-containing protein [Calothrix sp. SM1_5_4]
MAYPYGTYQHSVRVTFNDPRRTLDVRGVIGSAPDHLKVIGLSPLGMTIFRIDEDFKSGAIKREFYLETMKRHETRFMFFYDMLKALMHAPKERREFQSHGARFTLSEPDGQGVPRRILVDHPRVRLDIEVTGYEI